METSTKTLTGIVKAICISDIRGIEKHTIPEGHFIPDFGIEGDAHAGKWHRQVSLLSYDKVKAFNERGANVGDGAFGENLVVEGLDFRNLPVGTTFYRRHCRTAHDADRQGMSQPLCHLSAHGGVHNAQGGCVCRGYKRRDHPPRR